MMYCGMQVYGIAVKKGVKLLIASNRAVVFMPEWSHV